MEFKTIDGYPYEIYEDSRIFRMERVGKSGKCLHRIEIKPHKLLNGYLEVRLYCTKDKEYHKKYVHRIIWQAFHGDIGKLEIDHIDGNPGNCALSNLRAVTHQQNCLNEISLERYRRANALSAGKFNRERMQAARGETYYEELKKRYAELKKQYGHVGTYMVMRTLHVGYPRARKLMVDMESKDMQSADIQKISGIFL